MRVGKHLAIGIIRLAQTRQKTDLNARNVITSFTLGMRYQFIESTNEMARRIRTTKGNTVEAMDEVRWCSPAHLIKAHGEYFAGIRSPSMPDTTGKLTDRKIDQYFKKK